MSNRHVAGLPGWTASRVTALRVFEFVDVARRSNATELVVNGTAWDGRIYWQPLDWLQRHGYVQFARDDDRSAGELFELTEAGKAALAQIRGNLS